MIPFFEIPAIPVGPFRVQPFGLLVALAIGGGYFWLKRRLQQVGEDTSCLPGMVFWMLLAGFAGALTLKLVYLPGFADSLITSPGALLRMTGGIASFGGLLVGLAAGSLYLWWAGRGRAAIVPYLDALAFVFPRAWLFGRIGCALSHDHPGTRTEFWLGVRYPDATRWDLGLLEVLYTLLYLALLALLSRRERSPGFYLGLFLSTYAVFRFGLDRLHEDPVRYMGWTVDQYGSILALVTGIIALAASLRPRPVC